MSSNKEDNKENKVIQSEINKKDLIVLLQKVQNDYEMIDCKMKELLDPENIRNDANENDLRKLSDIFNDLSDFAKKRDKKIEELLKMMHN
jgi:hypothetical protein